MTATWCESWRCASPSRFLQAALRDIPEGPIMDPKAKLRGFRPKPGEAYGRIEAPKGELGFYVISDGSPNPYRYRVRPPSFINLTILEDMCLGHHVADVVIILGSVDIVMGEVGTEIERSYAGPRHHQGAGRDGQELRRQLCQGQTGW